MSTKTISLLQLQQLLHQGGKPHIVDVRTPAEFAAVHAVGAVLMPLDKLDPAQVAAQRRDAADAIYLICQSGARAAKASQRLDDAGLANVFCIEGGTAAWEKTGLPVEYGSTTVISLERQVRIAAGFLVLVGLVLAWTVHRAFFAIPAFVGTGLMFAGITDYCGMAMILAKLPWNR